MTSAPYEIIREIAVLSETESGWRKEINYISWNGEAPKIDIRKWGPNHEIMGSGINLDEIELNRMVMEAEAFLEFLSRRDPAGDPGTLWYCKEAFGNMTEDGFIIRKGSKIRETIAPSFKTNKYCTIREMLIHQGVITDFTFTRDYLFKACSCAAAIVLGRSANGWIEWKNDKGEPLDSIRE